MTSAALSAPSPVEVGLSTRSRRAADLAVDRIMGDDASPQLKKAAAEVVAPWAEKLVRGLDDLVRVPGTKFGIGLDAVIGFIIPGAGDVITGTGSVALLFLALKERVPTIVLLRMCMNILVDTVGGLLPILGDAFDVVWRSNRRNLDLIEQYRDDPKREPTLADYALVGTGLVLALLSVLLPIFIIYGVGFAALAGLGSIFS